MPLLIEPPPGTIVGTSPYFFRIGKSAGPTRSIPRPPRRAVSRHCASRSRSSPRNTPRQTPCLRRPGRAATGFDCARAVTFVMTAVAPMAARKSLRRRFVECVMCLSPNLSRMPACGANSDLPSPSLRAALLILFVRLGSQLCFQVLLVFPDQSRIAGPTIDIA